MKKLGILIALILCVTIGGVYATWTYTQNTDVADETINMTMNLTDVAYSGSYGTYEINTDSLKLKIDPKKDTTHTTALYIEGQIVITFTPNSVAPEEVKENGVASTFQFGLTNANWTYDDGDGAKKLITLAHDEAEDIVWGEPDENGVFTYIITAEALAEHINLAEFNLDTKVKYDEFNTVLGNGQITITVSDGITATNPIPNNQ
ncbi:MAG: hypothetical protein IKC71_02910 [Clostridia bacterium]|nr:hypothetical protein [Clostridia bacterium]